MKDNNNTTEGVDDKDVKKDNTTDWFSGRMNGSLPNTYADIKKNNPEGNFSLKYKDEYWADENIKNMFKEAYGDKASEEYTKYYDAIAQDFNNYHIGNFDDKAFENTHVKTGYGHIYGLPEDDMINFKHTIREKTISGSQEFIDMYSDGIRDPRKVSIDSEDATDLKGNK